MSDMLARVSPNFTVDGDRLAVDGGVFSLDELRTALELDGDARLGAEGLTKAAARKTTLYGNLVTALGGRASLLPMARELEFVGRTLKKASLFRIAEELRKMAA